MMLVQVLKKEESGVYDFLASQITTVTRYCEKKSLTVFKMLTQKIKYNLKKFFFRSFRIYFSILKGK